MYNLSELATYSTQQWLSYVDPVTYDFLEKFVLSLLIGLLIGIERERKSNTGDIFAGIRTFAIASISGMIATYIAIQQGMPNILYLTMIFFIIVATVIIYIKNVVYRQVGITGGI
ncbi:MAG: MgtC/SapB family protein, partial [Methanosarcinales archaeon]|nr:MgtC/SapB family protein [Methanosarcinales archaeon]